jgi:hypothetical protein
LSARLPGRRRNGFVFGGFELARAPVRLGMRAIGALLLVFLSASASRAADIRVELAPSSFSTPGASYPDRTTIDEALAAFMQSCAPLTTEYWSDVVTAVARVHQETYARARLERYGWRREIDIEIAISDHPKTIPRRFDVAGHTLHFALGGGTSPGIVGAMRVQGLCAMSTVRGDDSFKPVPELAVIDR